MVQDEPFDDTALIMEALMEIRANVCYIIRLLEDYHGEAEEEDA